jgi:hypothetical protein
MCNIEQMKTKPLFGKGTEMKTRFEILGTLIVIASILLSACSSAATATVASSQSLDLAPELAVGILKLEDTDQAVTSAQASDLLTYWQAYQALSGEETTAQAELEALVQQIKGVLSDEQWQAIQAMQLTSQSVNEMTQSLTAEYASVTITDAQSASTTGQSSTGMPGDMPGGGPGGSMPSDDMSILMGNGMDMNAQSTPSAAAQAQSSVQNLQVTPVLLNALIALMESRI